MCSVDIHKSLISRPVHRHSILVSTLISIHVSIHPGTAAVRFQGCEIDGFELVEGVEDRWVWGLEGVKGVIGTGGDT